MTTEQELRQRLRKISSLFEGATTAGERDAAAAAIDRVRKALVAAEKVEPLVETEFKPLDRWHRRLFLALCRRYGLKPYRHPRQRYSTVVLRAPRSFINQTLWPEFLQIRTALDEYLNEATESYATDAERDAAVKAFVENFAKQHPEATVDDPAAERHRLLVARDCRQTLANLADNRKPEKAPLQIVSPQEHSLMMAGRRFTRVDEYYDSTTHVWSIIFVDDPQHPESFATGMPPLEIAEEEREKRSAQMFLSIQTDRGAGSEPTPLHLVLAARYIEGELDFEEYSIAVRRV